MPKNESKNESKNEKDTTEPVKTIPAPPPADTAKDGCTTSFLNREKNTLDKECGTKPDPKEEYVQPEKEKESGGEG